MRFLQLLVFMAGFVSLGVELAAARLLDPWFGNSLLVWACLIGLALLFLAIGAWLGGRLADKNLTPLIPFRLIAWSGVSLAAVPTLSRPLLRFAGDALGQYEAGILLASFFAVLVLLAAPLILLGCITPYVSRLALTTIESAGHAIGRMSALSTGGGILGALSTPLVLIPWLGTRRTFLAFSLIMLLCAAIGYWHVKKRVAWQIIAAMILVLGMAIFAPTNIKPTANLLYETESNYNYVQVIQGKNEVLLKLNEGQGIHSVHRAKGQLADGIWDYFLLAPFFNKAPLSGPNIQRVAVIGLAGGTIAQLYTDAFGPVPIDGIELDPAVIEVGKRWFGMTDPNLNAIAQDGRYFLEHTNSNYDVIAVDAYRPPYIPFHLTTVEFFASVRQRLSERGVVAVNVARVGSDQQLVDAIIASIQPSFSSVFVIEEPNNGAILGNSLVVGTVQRVTLDDWIKNTRTLQNPLLVEVARRAQKNTREAKFVNEMAWTDDHAPIEQTVHALIFDFLSSSKQ